jgi:hypothetical protein
MVSGSNLTGFAIAIVLRALIKTVFSDAITGKKQFLPLFPSPQGTETKTRKSFCDCP